MAKYRRLVFDKAARDTSRTIFNGICSQCEATLVERDGERDHVHLLVEYPPKRAVSTLVNSLEGASSRVWRRERPDIAKKYRRGVLWSPSYLAASCGGAPLSIIRQYIEQQNSPD